MVDFALPSIYTTWPSIYIRLPSTLLHYTLPYIHLDHQVWPLSALAPQWSTVVNSGDCLLIVDTWIGLTMTNPCSSTTLSHHSSTAVFYTNVMQYVCSLYIVRVSHSGEFSWVYYIVLRCTLHSVQSTLYSVRRTLYVD